jgi:hypothetical protein
MNNKLKIVTTGVLANDPLIQWGAENMAVSNIHKFFDLEWIIVTHNDDRAERCINQAEKAPCDVSVIVDEYSRSDRTGATRRAIKDIELGSFVWTLPEGAIVSMQAGSNLFKNIKESNLLAFDGCKCDGLDHIIFKKEDNNNFANEEAMIKYFDFIRKKGKSFPFEDVIIMRNANTDMERLSVIYWTLKFHQHHYTDVYEKFMEPLRERKISLLEIGVAQGASLRTFRDFFKKADIFGIDIYQESILKEPRISAIVGDSTSQESRNQLQTLNKNKKFNIIIDDGSHFAEDQVKTFDSMWPLLGRNGIYFIEDIWGDKILHNGLKGIVKDSDIEIFDLRSKSGYGDSMIFMIKKR